MHPFHVGEALRLVRLGQHRPGHSALMFPPTPAPTTSFASTLTPASSDENDDDNDDMLDASKGFHRFRSSFSTPSDSGRGSTGGFSCTYAFTSTPLPHRGAFILASDPKETPSSALGAPPGDEEDGGLLMKNWTWADNEVEGNKEPTEDTGDESLINSGEIELFKGIIKSPTGDQPSTAPKSGDKWGSTHLDGSFISSDSSIEDLDASRGAWAKKKVATPTKTSNPCQWSDEDIYIVRQIHYKTDLKCFQTYHLNKIAPTDISSINTKYHSTYIAVPRVDPGSVIRKSVFSVAAYCETLRLQGGDTSKFDKEVGINFKKCERLKSRSR